MTKGATTRLLLSAALAGITGPGLAAQQGTGGSPISVLHVQGGVHLISGAGANITVQVGNGKNGVVLVDTPRPDLAPQVVAEVRRLSNNRPVRWIVNTGVTADAIAGNQALVGPAAARGTGGAPFGFVGLGRPSILAQENVLNRLSSTPAGGTAFPAAALPTMTYYLPTMDFYANGEGIVLHHAPAAITDSDSIVHFRGSDVISTGALFTPGRYPAIDLERGGSVQGLVLALGQVLALAVPEAFSEGGTKIIPGRGRICEETEVAEFRDMIAIIRDRVQDGIKKGLTEAQVVASRPSRDYDSEYGATQAEADRFVGTIYRSLRQPPSGGRS